MRASFEATGATLLYPPPYSPDFDLIGKPLSKLKAPQLKASERTVDPGATGSSVRAKLPQKECKNWFTTAGYEPA